MPFAGQMQILSLLCLSLLFFGSYRSFKPWLSRFDLFFCLTMANLAGVVFAGERSAWLGAAAGAVVLSALKSGKTLAKCLLALSIISALGWFCVPLVHTRIESLLSGQADVSTRVRLTLWRESIKCFASSPYVGVGFRKFPHFDIPEAIVPGRSRDLNHAHSNYLQLLATSGGLGLAAYLILWLAALAYAFGLFRRSLSTLDAEATGLAAGVLSGVVALMVAGIFEYNFGTAQVRLLQWFVLGMLSIPVLRADVPPEQAP